ncbi:MAG: beta-ketoacyl synthase N-terminal-like domain-containing protein, partial [Chloroflexota bacterium]
MEKIVITGMGTVNPLGLSVAEAWQAAVNGVSGVGPITQFDTS